MQVILALTILMLWYNTLTTRVGASIVSLAVDLLGVFALTGIMIASVAWSLLTLWGGLYGA